MYYGNGRRGDLQHRMDDIVNMNRLLNEIFARDEMLVERDSEIARLRAENQMLWKALKAKKGVFA